MFLLNGSAVALSRLSVDTMTRQSDWHFDWQTHTQTCTYIPPSFWQALPSHHWAVLEGSRLEKQFCLLQLFRKRYGRRTENTPHIIVFERLCSHPVCWSGLSNPSLLHHQWRCSSAKGHPFFSESGLLLMKALKYDTHKPQKHFVTLQETSVTAHLSYPSCHSC